MKHRIQFFSSFSAKAPQKVNENENTGSHKHCLLFYCGYCVHCFNFCGAFAPEINPYQLAQMSVLPKIVSATFLLRIVVLHCLFTNSNLLCCVRLRERVMCIKYFPFPSVVIAYIICTIICTLWEHKVLKSANSDAAVQDVVFGAQSGLRKERGALCRYNCLLVSSFP